MYHGIILSSHYLFSPLVTWLPPPLGLIKINFDDSMTSLLQLQHILYKISILPYMQVGGKLFTHALILFIKLIATWLGLSAAISNLNAIYISLGNDSATIISWINAVNTFHHNSNPFLQDIDVRKSSLLFLSIFHKYYEVNQVANNLAILALFGSFIWHNNDEVDLSCIYLLNANQQIVYFTRN